MGHFGAENGSKKGLEPMFTKWHAPAGDHFGLQKWTKTLKLCHFGSGRGFFARQRSQEVLFLKVSWASHDLRDRQGINSLTLGERRGGSKGGVGEGVAPPPPPPPMVVDG